MAAGIVKSWYTPLWSDTNWSVIRSYRSYGLPGQVDLKVIIFRELHFRAIVRGFSWCEGSSVYGVGEAAMNPAEWARMSTGGHYSCLLQGAWFMRYKPPCSSGGPTEHKCVQNTCTNYLSQHIIYELWFRITQIRSNAFWFKYHSTALLLHTVTPVCNWKL